MATNNNLIPINIKDLPKLDILSNSDLILIETVEGTATILYRDFIIDEAHTTFAATLSASVTNAVALSSAIDTTNATVKSVSASLYSSITGLSSSSFAYSNALSSSLVSLNATVTALSSDVNALSAQTLSLSTYTYSNVSTITSNVAAVSSTVLSLTSIGLSSRGQVFGSNTPRYTILDSDGSDVAAGNFFQTNEIVVKANKKYEIKIEAYFLKTTAGTMTFTLSSNQNPSYAIAVGRYILSPITTGLATVGTATMAGAVIATGGNVALPVTGSLSTADNHLAVIEFTIQQGSNDASLKLSAVASAGTYKPLKGSMFRVVQID